MIPPWPTVGGRDVRPLPSDEFAGKEDSGMWDLKFLEFHFVSLADAWYKIYVTAQMAGLITGNRSTFHHWITMKKLSTKILPPNFSL